MSNRIYPEARPEHSRSGRVALLLVVAALLAATGGCGRGRGVGSRGVVIAQRTRPPVTREKQANPPRQPRPARPVQIKLHEDHGRGPAAFEVVNLKDADLDKLTKADLAKEQWQELFSVCVHKESSADEMPVPPLLGSYRIEDKKLRFIPRYPPQRGLTYQAVFRPSKLPDHGADEKSLTALFTLAREPVVSNTIVEHVFPSSGKLPENQLKFYLHFSAPMSRGEAYRHVHLLEESGREVDLPFLELDEELWDPAGKRFTLFFDPGRIKRGLKPREEVGPVLVEGKSYTLVIDRDWPDARGAALKDSFRKRFQVLPPDDAPIDPKNWKITAPRGNTSDSLAVTFPKPLDHAMLERALWVTDARGEKIAGTILVGTEEKKWHLKPQAAWKSGSYQLVIDTTLEDLAGNRVGRPFEIDVFQSVDKKLELRTVQLSFEVAAK